MDVSLFKMVYSASSLLSLVVNFAVLVVAILALQRKMRGSVLVIAAGCVVGLIGIGGSFFLYSVFADTAHSMPAIAFGIQAFFMLHNILWAAGTILLLLELKDTAPPRPNP